jgi:hypothetical protein
MPKKLTTAGFIIKARKKHGDLFDYSSAEYVGAHDKVKIKCEDHGVFEQIADSHLSGAGCPKCGVTQKLTTEDFIIRAEKKHEYRYDYSSVEYVDVRTHVKIICEDHGVFEQTPRIHIRGAGCPKCAGNQQKTTEDFIIKAHKKHGDLFDYSLVEYVGAHVKVKIICTVHGVFEQIPGSHLSQGAGCPKCGGTQKLTTEDFIIKAHKKHGDLFDYSSVEYVNAHVKVKIICTVHGVFEQIPNSHLRGKGCLKCAGNQQKTTEDFIKDAREEHGDLFDYSLVEYVGARDNVKIKCEDHGVFEQNPTHHLRGQGCPKCANIISNPEQRIADFLENNLRLEVIRNDKTLIKPLELDIYLPDLEIAIEYCGLYWHSEERGKDSEYHLNKFNKCKELGIHLITIFEDEWLENEEWVKNFLENLCKGNHLEVDTSMIATYDSNRVFVDASWYDKTFWEKKGYVQVGHSEPSYSWVKRARRYPRGCEEEKELISEGRSKIWDCGKIELKPSSY